MPNHHRVQPLAHHRQQRSKIRRKPTGKELDLLVLAGCSCLMTLLHHPVSDALKAHTSTSNVASVPTRSHSTKLLTSFSLALPPERERPEIQEEEG